jgi:hypothetical protein
MTKRLVLLLRTGTAVLLLVFVAGRAYANQDAIVTGAAAYFAWVIFDSLKADLEKVSGRTIELHGSNSTLHCNLLQLETADKHTQ